MIYESKRPCRMHSVIAVIDKSPLFISIAKCNNDEMHVLNVHYMEI